MPRRPALAFALAFARPLALALARPLALALALPLAACSSEEQAPAAPLSCAPGEEALRGRCVDPLTRYEPEERVDHDNVVAYGDPLTRLELPEPPKSGFRLVAPPRTLEPGEEIDTCVSWPYPALQNKIVYAARLFTTPGLHHSNMIAKPVVAELGPNPYPGCHPGADDPYDDLPAVIPDVLFANSTQVQGGEALILPPATGFVVDTSREISTSVHYLNASSEPQVIEVVYDFFTMPPEALEREVAPFMMNVNDFLVPPHATEAVGASCRVFGGEIVSLMSHTHQYAERFTTDVVRVGGGEERVYEEDGFDLESDIRIYDPAIRVERDDEIRYECSFNNTTDHDIRFGLGDNEMCVLFGYIYPPQQQFVAYSEYNGEPCQSFQIGLFR